MNGITVLPFFSTWDREQSRWRDYYERRLQDKLIWAIHHVRGQRPAGLATHCDSLLTLLERARPYPRLRSQMIEMIVALGDWPVRWGQWHTWEEMLHFGLNVMDEKQEPARYASLLKQLAHLTLHTGRLEEAIALGRQTVNLAESADAPLPLAEAADLVVNVLVRRGDNDAAHDFLARAERSLASCSRVGAAAVYLYWSHALVARRQGRLDEMADWADRAVVWLEQLDPQHPLLGEALDTRGAYRWVRAEYAAAADDLKRAVAFHTQQGDEFAAIGSLGNLSLVYLDTGNLAQTEELIRRCIVFEERQRARWYLAINVGNLAEVYLLRGEFDRALSYNDQHLAMAAQNRDAQEVARAKGNRGKILLHVDPEAALPHLQAWNAFTREHGGPAGLTDSYCALARCLFTLGQPEALRHAQKALLVARRVGQPWVQIAVRCLAEQLPSDQREPLLQEALRMARQLGRQLDEAACLLWLANLKRGDEQAQLWDEGARLLDRCTASNWLKHYSPQCPPPIP